MKGMRTFSLPMQIVHPLPIGHALVAADQELFI
jgi:hypothetical protein